MFQLYLEKRRNKMSKSILGLFLDPNSAADAMDGLKESGFE